MRHLIVLALALGMAGWATSFASAQVSTTCAPNSGVTVTNPLKIANGTATVGFTVAAGCDNVQLSLVSYTAPSATYSEQTADQQVIYRTPVTNTFGPGDHTLSIDVPSCFYQVDFVYGTPITQLGPAGTNNFYGKQHRLIQGASGGSTVCTAPPTCPSENMVTLDNGGIKVVGSAATVSFTVAAGCTNVQLSLVSYTAPSATYSEQTASQQVLYRSATDTFDAGSYSMTVDVPSCYFQVDFVYGTPIEHLGPAGTNNFYSRQGRLIEGLMGGTTSCQSTSGGGEEQQVTICHATGTSDNGGNGYQLTSSSVEGVLSGHLSQHAADIIPPFTSNGTTYSQNWDAAGQAIFANGCVVPSSTSENTGGETQNVVQETAAPVPLPSITLVKLERVGSTGDFVAGPITAKVGDTIEYRLVVTNTGSTTVSVNLDDARCTSLTPTGPQGLVAGATLTYPCSHVITAADGGSYTNLAVATANNAGPVTVAVQSTVTATVGSVSANTPVTNTGGVRGAHKTVKHKAVHHKKVKKVKKVTRKAKAAHAVLGTAGVTG